MSKQAVSSSRDPGPQIRKVFLPLVAKGASEQKMEQLTGKLSSEFGISSEAVNAYRAWIRIHADKALTAFKEAHPEVKKLPSTEQLIELTNTCKRLPQGGRSKNTVILRLAKVHKLKAALLAELVTDCESRMFTEKQAGRTARRITKPDRVLSGTNLSLDAVKTLEVRDLIVGQVASFINSVDGRRLLRRARQSTAALEKSKDFPTLILFARLYADRFREEAGNLGIKIAESLAISKERSWRGISKELTNHNSEIEDKLDELVEKGYLGQRHHLQLTTLYALNPVLKLYYGVCLRPKAMAVNPKAVNLLVLEVAEYCKEVTAPVRQ